MCADADSPIRALMLVGSAANRRLLGERLEEMGHDVVEPPEGELPAVTAASPPCARESGALPEFDLCVLDPPAVESHGEALRERRSAVEPRLLPCLLLVPGDEHGAGRRAVERLVGETGDLVDDFLRTPVRTWEFDRRVGTLLRARELSERLHRSTDRYRRLVETIPAGVAVLREGRVVWSNPSLRETLSPVIREPESSRFVEFVVPDDRDAVADLLASPDESDAPEFVEASLVGGVTAELAAVRIEHEGEPAVQLLVRDVTDRVYREERLAVLDRIIRHNLRNKLNVALGHAEMLDGTGSDLRSRDAILESLEGVLDLSRKVGRVRPHPTVEPEPTDVAGMVRDAVDSHRAVAPDATIETELPEEAWALGSPDLELVIDELLQNAVEHSDRDEPTVEVEVTVEDGWVHLAFVDDGPLVPENELVVFSGSTETQLEHASSLGLWLVNWTVREHGGHVSYEALGSRGNRIVCTLRAVEPG